MLLMAAGAARAQSIDYGALENLFGEPVTTSVTGSPQRASEVPGSMTIITADEIRRSGARDIPDVLKHVAGIDILQWTNDQADVAVRGYNQAYSPRLLVLIDGRQVYTDYYGYTPWSTLPVALADIRQIEIVKGPNSALFGFNAAAGVVNIVTFNPLYDDTNTISVMGGTQGLAGGSAVITHQFGDRAGLRLSVTGHRDDDFSTAQMPYDIGTRQGTRRFAADFDGRLRLAPDTYMGLEISHSEVRLPEMTPLYSMFFVRYRTNSAKVDLSVDTDWGLVEATAYANWFRANAESPALPGIGYPFENVTYVAQLKDIFKVGSDHTVRISAEYRHNSVATGPLTGASVFYNMVAGGAMWQWAVTPEITITNAVRVDHLSLGRTGLILPGFGLTNADWDNTSITEPTFNSGIVWHVDQQNTLRITIARGAQLPNLLNLGGLLDTSPFGYAAGVPFLKPAVVMNYELGWTSAIPSLDATLILRAFHQSNRDLIANFGGSMPLLGLISTPANIGRSNATGLELSIKGTAGNGWRWGLSYTPEVIDDHFVAGYVLANTLINYEDTLPVHVVKANLGWSGGPWEMDGYLRYESDFYGIRGGNPVYPIGMLVHIPDYVSLDARLAYRVTDYLTFAVSGQNLLQARQTQTSAPQVERSVFLTVTANL